MTGSVRHVASEADLLAALGPIEAGSRAIILIGGADATEPERLEELRRFFDTLVRHCEATRTTVVDGGTDSGVMRLIAEARTAVLGTFRLIGVAPEAAFDRPTKAGEQIAPARDHSMILAVPGEWFGDETRWLFATGDHLAGGAAPTIVVNGGALTMDEALQRLEQGHRVIAVAGSGRAADELAADRAYETLRTSGRLRVMHLTADEAGLIEALRP
jgi:hypothetical protein